MIKDTKEFEENEIPTHLQERIDIVASHLLTISATQMVKYDKNEKVYLGNGQFWLIRKDGNISLGFNLRPSEWDMEAIKYSILVAEHDMFKQRGAVVDAPPDYMS